MPVTSAVAKQIMTTGAKRLTAAERMAIAQRVIAQESSNSSVKTIISKIGVDARVRKSGAVRVSFLETQLWDGAARLRNMAVKGWYYLAGGSETRQADKQVGKFFRENLRV